MVESSNKYEELILSDYTDELGNDEYCLVVQNSSEKSEKESQRDIH